MRDYREVMRVARDGTDCDDATAARLERVARGSGRSARLPVAAAAVAGLALAASLLWAVRPLPPLDRSLDNAGAVALGSYVDVDADGSGEVKGNARSMELAWQQGTLSVEVEPDRGVGLAVHTPDGVARVVGTGFDVTCDALGTTVSVRHGQVAVDCLRGESAPVHAGGSLVCRPPSAAGSLGRVLALRGQVSPQDLLEEIDGALSLPDAVGPVASELHVLRVSVYLAADRPQDALAEAEAALSLPVVTRAEELHRFAARLRLRARDCEGARPHVEALVAAGALLDDAPAWAACAEP